MCMKAMLWRALVTAATLLPLMQQARAATPEDFYRGKQVRIIVSFDAGTDYDQWARLIARHLGKHLDGHPTLVVQNMGAAGGILATNHLFNVAPHDGTVIGMIGRNLPYFALVQEANARYDPAKFNWIGSPELTNRVCTAYERSAVRKAEDLFERELLTGGAGAAGCEHDTGAPLQTARHEIQADRGLPGAGASAAGDGARRGRRLMSDRYFPSAASGPGGLNRAS